MDHLLRHENRHRHADNQPAEFGYFVGLLHHPGVQVRCFAFPPGHVGFKAAQAPLFKFAHHGSHPMP
ncbi:hypothetical protein [Enterobacter hormaechei]|uniref:hypothetical protein n=1 Tax=Enterobacter hormaechei TaxID=158836 RepID=UPI003D6E450C